MRSTIVVAALALSLLTLNAEAAGTLYGVNDSSRTLFTIDPVSLTVTTIGSLGVESGEYGDLAYDETTGTMWWVAGRDDNSLYTIDLTTGEATLVGEHGIDDLFALGTVYGGLYGQDTAGDIYELDTTTGAPTYFGSNTVYPGGFDWNPDTQQMILLEAGGSGSIYSVDDTGVTTLLASPGYVNDNDIAYDGDRSLYWAADWSGNLYQYDGSWNRTTVLSGIGDVAALEYVPSATIPAPGALLLAGTGLLSLFRLRRKLTA